MAYYHTVPSYSSTFGQATKPVDLSIIEANPRGLGPPPPNAYKRAVLRDPPKQFKVSVLPPKKLGSGWAYGLRVISTVEDEAADRRSVASRSVTSSSSYRDYEVWRRWDDCLWFQEALELEYSIQAREKRRRLEQGKGVKKNGVYIDSKQAASFDSLPPGPDPTSVSLDIHDYIPKLSKKATLFRANQITIDQRQQQFSSLINALFAPDVPVLIEELRRTVTVKDFFGWWRRDKDFARKHGPGKGKSPEVPILDSVPFYLDVSDSSNVFSSSQDLPRRRSKSTRPSTADASTSDSRWPSPRNYNRDDVGLRRRTTPTPSSSSPTIAVSSPSTSGSHEPRPDSPASLYSAVSGELSPTVVMWDGHEQLNASDRVSPNAVLDAFPQTPMVRETFENIQCPPSPEAESPILGLEALPEEPELELPPSQMFVHEQESWARPPTTKPRSNSLPDSRHRNGIVFSPETALGDAEVHEIPERSPTTTNTSSSRHSSLFSNGSLAPSWRTSASDVPPLSSPRHSLDSCTTDAVDYSNTGSPVTPHTPWLPDNEPVPILGPAVKRNPRESIASIDSIMSDTSVDQVLPRGVYMTPQSGEVTRGFPMGGRNRHQRFVTMSVPEEDSSLEDCDDVTLDSYLFGIEEMEVSGESGSEDHNPHRERSSRHPTSEQLPRPFQGRPPEQFHLPWTPTTSSAPHSPWGTEGSPISPISSISMASTSTVSLRSLSIKAYLTEDVIVVFRVAFDTPYAEIRDKIYDKFVNQEGVSLRHDFPLAYLVPVFPRNAAASPAHSGATRKRAGSVGSASTNQSSLLSIRSPEVWEEIVRDSDGKLTLRVFE